MICCMRVSGSTITLINFNKTSQVIWYITKQFYCDNMNKISVLIFNKNNDDFGNLALNWKFQCPPSNRKSFIWMANLWSTSSTSKVISRRTLTCDSACSWRLYSAAPFGDQDGISVTWCPTQSHYPNTEPTSPSPILIMLSTWTGSDKHTFLSHWFDSRGLNRPKQGMDVLLIQSSRLVSNLV